MNDRKPLSAPQAANQLIFNLLEAVITDICGAEDEKTNDVHYDFKRNGVNLRVRVNPLTVFAYARNRPPNTGPGSGEPYWFERDSTTYYSDFIVVRHVLKQGKNHRVNAQGLPIFVLELSDLLNGDDEADWDAVNDNAEELASLIEPAPDDALEEAPNTAPRQSSPETDRSQIETFVLTLFKHATPGNWASLRIFHDGREAPPVRIKPVKLNGNLDILINQAFNDARLAASGHEKLVFCPPIATFTNSKHAGEQDLAEGLALSTECDKTAPAARAKQEAVLGAATVVVASGGESVNETTGEAEPKLHVHYRLKVPTRNPTEHRMLKEARRLAVMLVGADKSNVPICHPIRWPGSLHRKGTPKLCHIVACNPDTEIDLPWALMRLREAVEAEGLGAEIIPFKPRRADGTTANSGKGNTGPANPNNLRAPCIEAVIDALTIIPNDDLEWDEWNYVGLAIYGATAGSAEGGEAFATWSAKSKKNDPAATQARWEHYHTSPPDRIGYGTLVWLAREAQPDWDPPTAEGVTRVDFRAHLPDHTYIFTPTGAFWNAAGVNACLPSTPVIGRNGELLVITRGANKGQIKIEKATTWLDRNQPVHHLAWAPGHPMLIENQLIIDGEWVERNGATTFNLYRPPALKHGDPSKAGPWLELVHKVYPEDAGRLIPKLAHRVQRPQEKINHAVLMGGPPGIGKDTILEPVRRAVGAWNWRETSPTQMLGRFNGYLQSVIMRINEVRDLGEFNRYQFYEHTKPFFAAPPTTQRVDEKGIPEHEVMNVLLAILTTNRTDGIYLPPDDRRHDVMWSRLTKYDFTEDYWIKIWKWYDEGGDGHVAAYLATLDISALNPKAPPSQTEAFWTIVNANRAPEEGELQDLLDKLGNPDAVTVDQIVKAASGTKHVDIRNWLSDRKNRRSIPHRFDAVGYVPVHNEAAQSGLWVVGGERQAVYAKKDLLPRERLAAVTALKRKADEEATATASRKGGGQPAAAPPTSSQETELDRNVVELLKRPKE
jgi:hypothetical protein